MNHYARCASAGIFLAFIAILTYRAWTTFDRSWDTSAYHLPFAAFRVGLSDMEHYVLPAGLQGAYLGFPPLIDHLRGWLWAKTGNVNATNLVNVLALAGYVLFLNRRFCVPLALGIIALMAIPTLHDAATSSYTDLLANLFFAAALLSAVSFFAKQESTSLSELVLCVVCLVGAANVKPQFMVLAGFAAVVPAFYLGRMVTQCIVQAEARARTIPIALTLALLVVGVYWVPLRNLLFFHNPLYPMQIAIGGLTLPGPFTASNWREPLYLEGTFQPFRWLLSVVEYRAFDGRPLPYTIDQGSVSASAMSNRMGGYFFPLVTTSLTAISVLLRDQLTRFDSFMLGVIAGSSLCVAPLPGSHELRYYSFWIVLIVSYALVLGARHVGSRQGLVYTFYGSLCVAFLYVSLITGLSYLVSTKDSVFDVVKEHRIEDLIKSLQTDTRTVCLLGWGPYPFLFDNVFHQRTSQSIDRTFIIANAERECRNEMIIKGPW